MDDNSDREEDSGGFDKSAAKRSRRTAAEMAASREEDARKAALKKEKKEKGAAETAAKAATKAESKGKGKKQAASNDTGGVEETHKEFDGVSYPIVKAGTSWTLGDKMTLVDVMAAHEKKCMISATTRGISQSDLYLKVVAGKMAKATGQHRAAATLANSPYKSMWSSIKASTSTYNVNEAFLFVANQHGVKRVRFFTRIPKLGRNIRRFSRGDTVNNCSVDRSHYVRDAPRPLKEPTRRLSASLFVRKRYLFVRRPVPVVRSEECNVSTSDPLRNGRLSHAELFT